jgi:hypothetical protein
MRDKSNPSISVPKETMEEFDNILWELQAMKELPRDTNRSEVITRLMSNWSDAMLEEYPALADRLESEPDAGALDATDEMEHEC